jgi:CheY-like chemotaxis protein
MSIFKKCPFYRDSGNLSTGKGLGHCDLCGVQAICEGDIQFCEKPDILRQQLSDQKKNEVRKNKEEEAEKKKPSQYKVLVVDDEADMRQLVVGILSLKGHQCITASNGMEALNKIIQNKFDAVIADIIMPQMDGITLTKELLSLYPNLPILIMTGYSKDYPTDLAIAAGARDFIGKPFSIDEFILRFNKVMSEQEILSQTEVKQNEMFLRLHPESLR